MGRDTGTFVTDPICVWFSSVLGMMVSEAKAFKPRFLLALRAVITSPQLAR